MKTIRMSCVILGFLFLVLSLSAQIHTLTNFDFTDGAAPDAALLQGTDGNFYGTTSSQGTYGYGTLFKMTLRGVVTTLYNFCALSVCADGSSPITGLVQASNGSYYGTTLAGGVNNDIGGTIFRYTPGANGAIGTLKTIYSFCNQNNSLCLDGEAPSGGLMQASDGDLYGTTEEGGAYYSGDIPGRGTIFKINPNTGAFTTLHSFNESDGGQPMGNLIQGTDGNIYGTASEGGANIYGTVFKINPTTHILTTLHSFEDDLTEGGNPNGGLVQYTNGDLYGTTFGGGAYSFGTVFKISPTGTYLLKTLYSFCRFSCTDGSYPRAGLVLANDGNFYGTTTHGGKNSYGTIFQMVPGGMLRTLESFCPAPYTCDDGKDAYAPLVQDTNGIIYGTTQQGGTDDGGTVFSLVQSPPLHPFVEIQPSSGKVGATVGILGSDFSPHITVSFNGATATSTSSARLYQKVTIPAGATTGTASVVGTMLQSLAQFRVIPQFTSFIPTSGPVGTEVTITGVSLTQTTKVTFGGVKATTFTVNSDTQVTATVPATAVTGKIAITTAGGTAASVTNFAVTP